MPRDLHRSARGRPRLPRTRGTPPRWGERATAEDARAQSRRLRAPAALRRYALRHTINHLTAQVRCPKPQRLGQGGGGNEDDSSVSQRCQ